jgi:hypothetical protein
VLAIVALGGISLVVLGQSAPKRRSAEPISLIDAPQRARPPVWSIDVMDAFFDDARQVLFGPRPDIRQAAGVVAADARRSTAPSLPGSSAGAMWPKLIEAEAIETEIKRLAQAVAADVTTAGAFKGGGYRDCRRHFSLLAVLFAAVAEYDGPVRWQDAAPGSRDAFARAARAAEEGSDVAYSEAVARKQDLEELVRGARPNMPSAEPVANWGSIADRPPLMQRINTAHQERLTKWLSSAGEFTANRDEVRHEAQIIAMLADVIGREGFDYWDDDEYAALARALREAATDVSAAAALNNYEQARRAIDRAGKACASCHEAYRG